MQFFILLGVIIMMRRLSASNNSAFLAKQNKQLLDILDSIHAYFYSLDTNWNFLYVSKCMADDFDLKPEQLLGRNFWGTFPRFLGTAVEKNFRETMEKRETHHFEWQTIYAKGHPYREFTVFPSADGITIYGADISQRKKAEDALNLAQIKLKEYASNLEHLVEERTHQLRDSERLATIGATAGMVGHDIRNPLQAMMSDIYLLKSEITSNPQCKNAELIESLDSIEQNISYINKIVADLQDYARPLRPELAPVNASDVFIRIFETVRLPDSIKLVIKVRNLEHVQTDAMLLQRALSNLVTNAIQAMPEGGTLEIKAYPEESNAIFTVSDTGVGIPDEVKPKLFTPMMTTKSKGQGFGLAVTKRLVEALKGTISFESEKGKGTKFIIQLPIAQ
jgi:Signal transduction histidine kinase